MSSLFHIFDFVSWEDVLLFYVYVCKKSHDDGETLHLFFFFFFETIFFFFGFRSKRSIVKAFSAPGTRWCGHKTTAEKFYQLGAHSRTDRCCRQHDHCPHIIEGLTSKYHLFNYRLFTVSHCGCDQR